MSKFKFSPTPLPGLLVIEPKVFADERGFFMESYSQKEFVAAGFKEVFLQDNHSRSKKGVLRGLHYQVAPSPMGKLVKCLRGEIFDVAVDIRKGSPTYGRYHAEILSGQNHKMLYLPVGFAHGFLALEDDSDVIYKCTATYDGPAERGIIWNDPEIGIKWPLERIKEVLVSDRDQQHPGLKQAETPFTFNG